MKFILAMIICSSIYQTCLPPHKMPDSYSTHYECMIAGYNEAINKAKEIGPSEVNKYGTIIKFYCQQTTEEMILPKSKPKIQASLDI